jgi:hypothetical protein
MLLTRPEQGSIPVTNASELEDVLRDSRTGFNPT